jgi:FkbM family methyltransferase
VNAATEQPSLKQRLGRRLLPRPLRNFLRSPAAAMRWLRDESAYAMGAAPVEVQLRPDWTVRCHPTSARSIAMFRDDEDSRRELDAFVAHCTSGMRLLDVGANFGLFTLAALRFGGAGARVVAVEPGPTTARVLGENVKLADEQARVTVIEAAAGERDGELPMLTAGAAGEHYLIASDGTRPDARRVRQLTLSRMAREAGIAPTHVKIDVEGFEHEVLSGARELLESCRPVLFLEVHSAMLRARGRTPEQIFEMMRSMGYSDYQHRGGPIAAEEACRMQIARLVCMQK